MIATIQRFLRALIGATSKANAAAEGWMNIERFRSMNDRIAKLENEVAYLANKGRKKR